MKKIILALIFFSFAYLVWQSFSSRSTTEEAEVKLSVADTLSNDDGNFAKAIKKPNFKFPRDHAAHKDFKTEWWYFTGNLEGKYQNHFGYELTIFRTALKSQQSEHGVKKQEFKSKWQTSQVYMAHFALTDVANKKFYYFDDFSREANALAGVQAKPFRVWLNDWSIESLSANSKDIFPLRLQAKRDDVSVDFVINSAKDIVLQGDKGLSQKGPGLGNASYYYSLTRMPTEGEIKLGDKSYKVAGLTWMDREWSTSSLAKDQLGWDWFALQLSNDEEIMFYRLRNNDGSTGDLSKGTYVLANGKSETIALDKITIKTKSYWTSPSSKSKYPASWHMSIPSKNLELDIEPWIKNQELDLRFRYWEGAVRVFGSKDSKTINGNGYVELTGY